MIQQHFWKFCLLHQAKRRRQQQQFYRRIQKINLKNIFVKNKQKPKSDELTQSAKKTNPTKLMRIFANEP